MGNILTFAGSVWSSVTAAFVSLWTDVLQPLGSSFWGWLTSYVAWIPEGLEKVYNLAYQFILLKFGLRVASFTILLLATVVILLFCGIFRLFHRSYNRRRKCRRM